MYPGTVSCCRAPFEKRPPKPSEYIIGERVKEAFVAFAMADKSANAEEAERCFSKIKHFLSKTKITPETLRAEVEALHTLGGHQPCTLMLGTHLWHSPWPCRRHGIHLLVRYLAH